MDDELPVAQVHLQRGQIYRSCASASGSPRYVRILERDRGTDRYRIADAVTGRRPRDIDGRRLHPYEDGRGGALRRTGYVLVDPHEFVNELIERALFGGRHRHPFVIAGSAFSRDVYRGGFLRVWPDADADTEAEAALNAVRAVVSALETASFDVEPAPGIEDEIRVRFGGKLTCPAMHSSGRGRWYCDRERGHEDDHQDDRLLEDWPNTRAPVAPPWWLPAPTAPGRAPSRTSSKTRDGVTAQAIGLPS
ncbi:MULTISPECIES: hypothetical protein [Streptomyces]|uniref:Uncharacterized protein n=1 Tax=Streptomyces dengpaensis TaxID=2049881 RepID=A0ABM6T3Z9_9ACTN|nr:MULTISPECIES: hypothetical protein [Streptomyces]AVH61820.1 hypothetical protein C4B68_40615 [Streptomyces dengpaensis]PIB04558.1 hypothetical protein B1C81_32855 [Streptomyces sp. HG99]